MKIEQWKNIPDFPGYQVSDLGNARSLTRYVATRNGVRKYTGRRLKLNTGTGGYIFIIPSNDGYKKTLYIHQLVYSLFTGTLVASMHIAHKDSVKVNNSVSNLAQVMPKDNIHMNRLREVLNGGAKLCADDIACIRLRDSSHASLAAEYGVTTRTISSIINYKTWNI